MGEALLSIKNKLNELTTQVDSYVSKPGVEGELIGPDGVQKLVQYMGATETGAMGIIEVFLTDETKTEAASWSQVEKDEMARTGLQLFDKVQALDRLIAHQGGDDEETVEPGTLAASGRSAAGALMQLLCVVRGFTQLTNFFLIDATVAIVYIIRDKIQRTIHLSKGTYGAVQEAWRLRCG